jgi:hypothetical protein
MLVMESAVCDGDDVIALQSYRFACRIGPIIDQEHHHQGSIPWQDTLLRRLGAALTNLISGSCFLRLMYVCLILFHQAGF